MGDCGVEDSSHTIRTPATTLAIFDAAQCINIEALMKRQFIFGTVTAERERAGKSEDPADGDLCQAASLETLSTVVGPG